MLGHSARRSLATTAAAATLAAASLLAASPATATSSTNDGNPAGGILGGLGKVVHHVTHLQQHPQQHGSGATNGSAGGSAASAGAGHAPVADVSHGQAQSGSGGSSSHADLLAVGGHTVIGSHADSHGQTHASGPVPRIPICGASGGALCIKALYADSSATGNDSSASTGVADVCLGGSDPTGSTCSGMHLGVAQNDSSAHGSHSASTSSVANACAAGDGGCSAGANVLGSRSNSGPGATQTKPDLVRAFVGDFAIAGPDDQTHSQVVRGCDPQVLCLVLNRAVTGDGSAQHGAVDTGALGDNATAGVGDTGTTSSDTGHGTPANPPKPSGPQHGSAQGQLGNVHAGNQPILGLSQNQSQGGLDHTKGDATLLSLFGYDVIASHADSHGDHEGHGPIPDNPLCASSGGALCLDPLYADSAASQGDNSSDANTQTGILASCIGGHDASGATCNGVELGVGQGSSAVHNDGGSGVTSVSSSTSLVDVCLHGTTGCTLAADLLRSDASADSAGGKDQSSSIADAGLDGTQVGAPADPIDVSVPADCMMPGIACVGLNQVSGQADDGSTGAGTTVVGVTAGGGTVGVIGSQTQVTANGGGTTKPPTHTPNTPNHPSTPTTEHPSAGAADAGSSGILPNTGGVRAGILGIGLLLIAAGAGALTGSRRRQAA